MTSNRLVLTLAAFVGSACLMGSAGSIAISHHSFHNPRLNYGFHHLPTEFFFASCFAFAAGGALVWLLGGECAEKLNEASSVNFAIALAGIFCLYWLPILVTANFVYDDWQLLAAASVRTIIYHHPLDAWYALDSVNGNFRPLGTVLYIAYALKWFGLHATGFLSLNFVCNLGTVIVAFLMTRELGYTQMTGFIAGWLFLSRSILYTQSAWIAAAGDSMENLLCALTVLFVLKAGRHSPVKSLGCHLLAWLVFVVAMLAKQSAFTIPLVVVLLLLLRPGSGRRVPRRRRILESSAAAAIYFAPAAAIFLHGRALLGAQNPYPIHLTAQTTFRTFSYLCWYFVLIEFPDHYVWAKQMSSVLGLLILIALMVAIRRVPALLGQRPRDMVFLLAAAFASVSIFILLPTRNAPYYGATAALFLSIGSAILLNQGWRPGTTNRSRELSICAFYLLIVIGFLDIRVVQTGLTPSGGYLWGTYGMDTEADYNRQLRVLLASQNFPASLVFIDAPDRIDCAGIAVVADPALRKVLFYDSGHSIFYANNHAGNLPADDLAALRDPTAYTWDTPFPVTASMVGTAQWIGFADGQFSVATRPAVAPNGEAR